MSHEERPYCFSNLESVFPMGPDGLRETPESCLVCYCKTECLRAALQSTEAVAVREEKVDRAYEAGMMGFFERWSRRKALHRRRREQASDDADRRS
jgi:hypothetical protein